MNDELFFEVILEIGAILFLLLTSATCRSFTVWRSLVVFTTTMLLWHSMCRGASILLIEMVGTYPKKTLPISEVEFWMTCLGLLPLIPMLLAGFVEVDENKIGIRTNPLCPLKDKLGRPIRNVFLYGPHFDWPWGKRGADQDLSDSEAHTIPDTRINTLNGYVVLMGLIFTYIIDKTRIDAYMSNGITKEERHRDICGKVSSWIIRMIEEYAQNIPSDQIISQKRDFLDNKIIELIKQRGGLDEELGIIINSAQAGNVDNAEGVAKAKSNHEVALMIQDTADALVLKNPKLDPNAAWDRAAMVHERFDMIGISTQNRGAANSSTGRKGGKRRGNGGGNSRTGIVINPGP